MSRQSVVRGLAGAGVDCEKKSGPPLYQLPGHTLIENFG